MVLPSPERPAHPSAVEPPCPSLPSPNTPFLIQSLGIGSLSSTLSVPDPLPSQGMGQSYSTLFCGCLCSDVLEKKDFCTLLSTKVSISDFLIVAEKEWKGDSLPLPPPSVRGRYTYLQRANNTILFQELGHGSQALESLQQSANPGFYSYSSNFKLPR